MMKQVCILLGVLILGAHLFSQEVKVTTSPDKPDKEDLTKLTDSLELKLSATPDSLQWEILYELSRAYRDYPRRDTLAMQKGATYSQMAENLAISSSDTANWIKSLNSLVYFYGRIKGRKEELEAKNELKQELIVSQGYIIPDNYHKWGGDRVKNLSDMLLAFYDSTSKLEVNDAMTLAADGKMKPVEVLTKGKELEDFPGSWWVRLRLRSQGDHFDEHVFYTGGKRDYWNTVEVYVQNSQGGFEKHHTGKGLRPGDWEVPDRPNHFRISVPPLADMMVYMRVKGFQTGFAPQTLTIRHINYESFLLDRVKTRHTNGIFQGVVLIQLFFFLLLYLATRDHIYGNYVIYILGLSVFIITVNYFDHLDSIYQASLYLIAIWLATVGMLLFSHAYLNMKELMPKWKQPLKVFLIVFTGLAILISCFFPFMEDFVKSGGFGIAIAFLFGLCSIIFGAFILTAAVFLPIWGIRTMNKGYEPAKYYLIATLFLFLGFLVPIGLAPFLDKLQLLGYFDTITLSNLVEGGIALQLCLFALGVGHQRNLLEREKREALEKNLAIQQAINTATDRFVPYEFLKTLGRESILDVHLGDQVEKDVTIFFSDIRDYTSLSEKLTPAQNFLFLNNYLGRVGPIIKTNRGFVNQYYGDGIMALFMDANSGIHSPKDSVMAALEMHKELHAYNQERTEKDRDPINIGIGIHSGPLMLGVIGDEKRMDVSVVSDAVNTASRMEGLTKVYGASTIVSESTFNGMVNTDGMNFRFLGQVLVKGKENPIKIYDFFDGDHEEVGTKKDNTLQLFKQGLAAYFSKNFKEAEKIFQEILQAFPTDKASLVYLDKVRAYLISGVPDDWTGVEVIDRK